MPARTAPEPATSGRRVLQWGHHLGAEDSAIVTSLLTAARKRGELAGGPTELGGIGVVASVELAVRLMLNDVDRYDDLIPKRRRGLLVVARHPL